MRVGRQGRAAFSALCAAVVCAVHAGPAWASGGLSTSDVTAHYGSGVVEEVITL